MKLITITLNPAIDVTLLSDGLHADKANHVVGELREAGGKGVNVSRVAKKFDTDGTAFALVGNQNLNEYLELLSDSVKQFDFVSVDGRTRENLTIRAQNECVKFNRMGFVANQSELNTLLEKIKTTLDEGDLVAVSGSLPVGLNSNMLCDFCLGLKSAGGKVMLDTESVSLDEIKSIKPYAIKPNHHEFAHLYGKSEMSDVETARKMQELYDCGVENILLTLGEKGMTAIVGGVLYHADGVSVEAKSTVCAGDSTLAGFAIAKIRNLPDADCIRLASACGTATVLCEGSGVCSETSAQTIAKNITVNRI